MARHEDDSYGACVICRIWTGEYDADDEPILVGVPFPCAPFLLAVPTDVPGLPVPEAGEYIEQYRARTDVPRLRAALEAIKAEHDVNGHREPCDLCAALAPLASPDAPRDGVCWFCKRAMPTDALIAGYDTFDEQRLACLACNERMSGNWSPDAPRVAGLDVERLTTALALAEVNCWANELSGHKITDKDDGTIAHRRDAEAIAREYARIGDTAAPATSTEDGA